MTGEPGQPRLGRPKSPGPGSTLQPRYRPGHTGDPTPWGSHTSGSHSVTLGIPQPRIPHPRDPTRSHPRIPPSHSSAQSLQPLRPQTQGLGAQLLVKDEGNKIPFILPHPKPSRKAKPVNTLPSAIRFSPKCNCAFFTSSCLLCGDPVRQPGVRALQKPLQLFPQQAERGQAASAPAQGFEEHTDLCNLLADSSRAQGAFTH